MLASDRTRRSASLIAPGHPATRPERRLDLLPVFEHCRHHIERPKHADGAVVDGEDQGLLRRQRKTLRRRVIGEVIRCSLMRQPFAQVTLVNPGFGGELRHRHRSPGMQDFLQTNGVTDPNQRH